MNVLKIYGVVTSCRLPRRAFVSRRSTVVAHSMTSLAKCPPPPRAAFPHPTRGQYPPSTTRRDRRKLVVQKRRFVAGTTTAMTAMTSTDEVEENRQDPRKLLLPTRSRHGRGTASTFPAAFSFCVGVGPLPPPRRLTQKQGTPP